jgi:hypothetical protein
MVMLWEEWQDQLQNGKPSAVAAPTQQAAIQTGKSLKKNILKRMAS